MFKMYFEHSTEVKPKQAYLKERPERGGVQLGQSLLHAGEGLAQPLAEDLVVGLRFEGAPRLLVSF